MKCSLDPPKSRRRRSSVRFIEDSKLLGFFSRLRNVIKQFNRLDLCIYEKFMLCWQSLAFDVGLKLGLWGFCIFDSITNSTLILKVLISCVFARQTTSNMNTFILGSSFSLTPDIFTRVQLQHTFDACGLELGLLSGERKPQQVVGVSHLLPDAAASLTNDYEASLATPLKK